jgi:tRNA modification GTPase
MEAHKAGVALDLVSLHIQEATESIGEISGDIASEEVLEHIFSSFCLGK